MRTRRVCLVAAFSFAVLVALTSCGSVPAATSQATTTPTAPTGATAQATPGTVTPTGSVQVGTWMMTVNGAQAYPTYWTAPAGMPGMWGNMGAGRMAVVLDVSAQSRGTPPAAGTYAGPVCALRGGWNMMMGPMMGSYGAYGWHMMSAGMYRGPMAFMTPTSTRQFTMVCTDQTTGSQGSWNIGF